MAVTLDVTQDYLVFDNPESVTLHSRAAGDVFTTATWLAIRQDADLDQRVYLNLDASATVTTFTLLKAAQTTLPKFGDRLVDGLGVGHEVRQVRPRVWRLSFDCTCVRDAA